MERHTDARFTRDLCPMCTVKRYGDILADGSRFRAIGTAGTGAEVPGSWGADPEGDRPA